MTEGPRLWDRRLGAIALASILVLAGCTSPPSESRPTTGSTGPTGASPTTSPLSEASPSPSPPPPAPSGTARSAAPGQPPVVWVGGTITEIDREQVVVQEAFGSVVAVRRLGQGATAFFRVAGGAWNRLDDASGVAVGEQACVESLLDGETLLALRVFLGVDCGPA